jgi:poly-D-alanine transfer protein DltD
MYILKHYPKQKQKQKQQQQLQQQNQIALSQVIKQIAQQVANANPGTNATQVYEILVQLAKQTAGNEQATENIRQIYSQVIISPSGILSQSLARFAQQIASGSGSTNGIELYNKSYKNKDNKDKSKTKYYNQNFQKYRPL